MSFILRAQQMRQVTSARRYWRFVDRPQGEDIDRRLHGVQQLAPDAATLMSFVICLDALTQAYPVKKLKVFTGIHRGATERHLPCGITQSSSANERAPH